MYVRHRNPVRGGWDCTPDVYKSMGYTIGLPPGIYVPPTKSIISVSKRIEQADSSFSGLESNFIVQDRMTLMESEVGFKCHVRNIPADCTEERLRQFLSQHTPSQIDTVQKIVINPIKHFAFVYFSRLKTLDHFVNYQGQFELDGNLLQFQKAHNDQQTDDDQSSAAITREYLDGLIIFNLPSDISETVLRDSIERFALVKSIAFPAISGRSLGYALVELNDPTLVDLVSLQLQASGIDCRRCFPHPGQFPRDNEPFTPQLPPRGYMTLRDDINQLTIADVLNLDVTLTKPIASPAHVQKPVLRIFNVLHDENQRQFVVDDMRDFCARFGPVIEAFADDVWPKMVKAVSIPVVVVFADPHAAYKSQCELSGLLYQGNIVMTMLESLSDSNQT